jgi:hypothetical protein
MARVLLRVALDGMKRDKPSTCTDAKMFLEIGKTGKDIPLPFGFVTMHMVGR